MKLPQSRFALHMSKGSIRQPPGRFIVDASLIEGFQRLTKSRKLGAKQGISLKLLLELAALVVFQGAEQQSQQVFLLEKVFIYYCYVLLLTVNDPLLLKILIVE